MNLDGDGWISRLLRFLTKMVDSVLLMLVCLPQDQWATIVADGNQSIGLGDLELCSSLLYHLLRAHRSDGAARLRVFSYYCSFRSVLSWIVERFQEEVFMLDSGGRGGEEVNAGR
jgi:hypothetical protein